jgi:hypothetical protein
MRGLVLTVLIALQVILGLTPRGMVLCIHEDGGWFIESASALCCARACPHEEERPPLTPREETPQAAAPAPAEDGDPCEDFPLGAPEVTVSAAQRAPMPAELTAPLPLAPPSLLVVSSVSFSVHGFRHDRPPPREPPSLVHLRPVVLRC